MTLGTITDALVAAPAAFVVGLIVGLWIGSRYDVRRKRDT